MHPNRDDPPDKQILSPSMSEGVCEGKEGMEVGGRKEATPAGGRRRNGQKASGRPLSSCYEEQMLQKSAQQPVRRIYAYGSAKEKDSGQKEWNQSYR